MAKQTARLYITSLPLGGRKFHVTDGNNLTSDRESVLLSGKKQFLTVPSRYLVGLEKVPSGEYISKATIGDKLSPLPRPGVLESKVIFAEEVTVDLPFYLLLQQLSDKDGIRVLRRYSIDRGFDNRKKLSFIEGMARQLKKVEEQDNRLTTYGLGDKEIVELARRRLYNDFYALGSSPRIEDYF
ncbi:MAG: hypothetical protein Q8Q01_04755 [archaeon]|nr:hypothetical protein [archaeon]